MSKIVFKINDKQYEVLLIPCQIRIAVRWGETDDGYKLIYNYDVDGKYGPDVSLNEYIRTVAELRGTKAMCHEGGCGVCVVAVRAALPPTYKKKIFSVNSCLVSVLSCHGWEVITVEGIGNKTIGYHEIQKRLAQFNGTQCGYCTPGWVMNMFSLYEANNKRLSSVEVENSFASNLCRCTGYRPIADAFKSFASDADERLLSKIADLEDLAMFKSCGAKCSKKCVHKKVDDNSVLLGRLSFRKEPGEEEKNNGENSDDDGDWCLLENIVADNKMIVIDCGAHKWFKAYSLTDVFQAMGSCDDYKLIAGNTGQGVYHVTDYPTNVIDIFNVPEIKGSAIDVNLILGAGMPLSEMMELFLELSAKNPDFSYLKQFYDHMDLVAHIPVRNIGTIGGNLFLKYANNEFQSDVFLIFETVGAMMTIVSQFNATQRGQHFGNDSKIITFPEFLQTDMRCKIIVNILLPPLSRHYTLKTYKIMPRSQNAHAAVNAGFLFKFQPNTYIIEKATIVYGSISPTFIHASRTEAALVGKDPYTNDTLQLALRTLADDIHPEEAPPEPTASYRRWLALALYYKAILSLSPDDRIDPRFRSGGEAIKRHTSQGTQVFDTEKDVWPLNQPIPKLEGMIQCSGEAVYANDLPKVTGEVFGAFVTADVKPGSIISDFDTTEAFKIPGVVAFYTSKDIPGDNCFTPLNVPLMVAKEEILCSKIVKFYGEPAGIIVADREKTAKKAARLVKIKYAAVSQSKPLITIDDVMKSPERSKRVTNDAKVQPTDIGNNVKSVVYGEFKIESQYHYYMEPQTCVVVPNENGMDVYSATQWMDMVNIAIAQSLKVPVNSVNVIVRRVGGAYGGKLTRATLIACAAALVTHLHGKTCRFILDIETNMKIIGKRLPTNCGFEVGVNKEGEIQYLKHTFYQDNGCAANETIGPGTALHFKNCYNSKRWYIDANSVATDTASNTWCRAPSSTEGIAMIEVVMERIAYNLGKDPIQVRLANMSNEPDKENPIPDMIEQIRKDSNYDERLDQIRAFNYNNRWRKRALKLLPMTYDLFYFGNYNAIISIYHGDGSVVVTHGGIEMGQGLNTKAAQVCAYALGVPLENVKVNASSSFSSPNAMALGGSIGSECVSFAIMKACEILNKRLEPLKDKMGKPSWQDLINKAFGAGIDLQASYMYSNNDDVKPYDIYGVVALEVEVDLLTGNHEVKRVDILEDTGRSLSPLIDIAQIEGAFVMGLGYWTTEKCIYDPANGKLLTDRTWTYKPLGLKDIPADFRIYFRRNARNKFGVLQSKATGEPAFCLATVIIHALREAVRSSKLDAGYEDQWVEIKNPCTNENIFKAAAHKLEHFKLK